MHSRNAELKVMNRYDLTQRLTSLVDDEVVIVAGIGNTNFDLVAAQDRPSNFYMLGSMGLAVPIALGIALTRPERQVIALEGDGSILMNLGTLTTVAVQAPPNLTVVVWDNGLYQITGSQATATAAVTDIVAVASGCGIRTTTWATDESAFEDLVRASVSSSGPHFIAARVDASPGKGRPARDPVLLKHRFLEGILRRGCG